MVILPFVSEHEFMLRRNLVYTAMTRVKKELFCFGSKEMFQKSVKDPYHKARYSLLQDRFKGMQIS
jgi:exodeoxyribonuclease V alpha subunit